MESEIVVRTTNECSCLSSMEKDNDVSREKSSLFIEGLQKMSYADVDCLHSILKRMDEIETGGWGKDLREDALISLSSISCLFVT